MRNQEDLDRLFSALDVVYFHGELRERGWRVRWKRYRLKRSVCFGQCDHERKTVWISRVLADLAVPDYVALATVYHEQLHAVLGPEHDDHGAGFHAAESRFVHHAVAEVWEAEHHPWMLAKQQS